MVGFGPHVDKYAGSIEQPHDSQVGGTGGKSFVATLSRSHADNCQNNTSIGNKDYCYRENNHYYTAVEKNFFKY